MTTDNSRAAVRVCAIADIQCSRGCGTGACKREQPAAAPIPVGTIATFSGKHGLTWAVDPETLPEGTQLYAGPAPAPSPAAMPVLTNAMRAVITNESGAYQSADDLYAALCAAADDERPAQADARVRLTDEQREAIEYAVTWLDENVSNRYAYTAAKELRALLATRPGQPGPRAVVTEEQPSLTNPLTPYGMLVRALRIVSGTTLMDMAEHLGRGPAELSAIEFGRKPVRDADIVDAAHFFACAGIQSTTHALTIAARAGGQHADQA